jgi:Cu+-exporting ATPase
MSGIQEMMKKAQTEKPPVQQLADRISAVFVPAVLLVAALTFLGNLLLGQHTVAESLMRSVAVLVIACPCAMGLATPAAIAVGLGRAARHGILYTDVKRMELFRNIRQMVFDKTGTLTTGKFSIAAFEALHGDEESFRKLVFSLEKFSNHPIARSIAEAWRTREALRLQKVKEVKGEGMQAEDKEGNVYRIGSKKILQEEPGMLHSLYVTKNGELIGWIDIVDEIRPEAAEVIAYCRAKGIKTVLLSGDSEEKCVPVADALGIDTVYAAKSPAEKLEIIDRLSADVPTVMVGDGINDAPALAKATISVSLADASQLAIQSAGVVLTQQGLKNLPVAMQLGKLTYGTVKSNLFWAFIYNIVAIPVAALGYLHPAVGALIMGGSDVVLALNSLYLGVRKLQ